MRISWFRAISTLVAVVNLFLLFDFGCVALEVVQGKPRACIPRHGVEQDVLFDGCGFCLDTFAAVLARICTAI